MFITFEGIEGSGKSTQLKIVSDLMDTRKIPCIKTLEPGGTETGKKLRSLLLATKSTPENITELLLYAADRAEHIIKVINPALLDGKTVLCDRFIDSTYVYQGSGRKIDTKTIDHLYMLKPFDIKPDITFLLDLNPETGLKRISNDLLQGKRSTDEMRFENEKISFHKEIRRGYLDLAESDPDRIKVIDAGVDVDSVTNQILNHLNKFYNFGT